MFLQSALDASAWHRGTAAATAVAYAAGAVLARSVEAALAAGVALRPEIHLACKTIETKKGTLIMYLLMYLKRGKGAVFVTSRIFVLVS